MYNREEISQILDGQFHVDYLAVVHKTVIPPIPFVCKKGMVLYDRFFYVLKGKILFDCHGNHWEYGPGSFLYLPYNITYKSNWDISREGEFISVNFILRDAQNRLLSLSDQIEHLVQDTNQKYLLELKQLVKVWEEGALGYKLKYHSQFYNILRQLLIETEQTYISRHYTSIANAILYLENHYLADVTTKELIQLTSLKECMFRRTFKAVKGMSPIKYRNMLRLLKAYEMLQSGEYSVLEVSLAVGFNDPAYFNRLFKEQFKVNPSECINQ